MRGERVPESRCTSWLTDGRVRVVCAGRGCGSDECRCLAVDVGPRNLSFVVAVVGDSDGEVRMEEDGGASHTTGNNASLRRA